MDEAIKSNLALQIAQLAIDKAALGFQIQVLTEENDQLKVDLKEQVQHLTEELNRTQAERDQLLAELELVTAPANKEKGEQA